jgi:hypothetical protein
MATKLQGATALRKALKDFTPTLAKETTKEIAAVIKPLARNARGFLPSNQEVPSGWLKRPNARGRWAARYYDASEARRGIAYRTTPTKPNRSGFRALASISNKSASGAIYETAGRKSGVVGNFTPKLGGQLVGDGQKSKGRAIFRAAKEDQGKATAGVIKAIESAAAKFNAATGKL